MKKIRVVRNEGMKDEIFGMKKIGVVRMKGWRDEIFGMKKSGLYSEKVKRWNIVPSWRAKYWVSLVGRQTSSFLWYSCHYGPCSQMSHKNTNDKTVLSLNKISPCSLDYPRAASQVSLHSLLPANAQRRSSTALKEQFHHARRFTALFFGAYLQPTLRRISVCFIQSNVSPYTVRVVPSHNKTW